jgi:molybdopterin converting factor small subunit
MTVRVLAFARVRELLGFAERAVDLPAGATARDAWEALAAEAASLRELSRSTRLAQNGAIVDGACVLHDGDELALLPPAGGG